MNQAIDHIALLPGYSAAGTVVLVLLADLVWGRRGAVTTVAAAGFAVTAGIAAWSGTQPSRQTFCSDGGCSLVTSVPGAVFAVTFAVVALAVLGLSAPTLRRGDAPSGEYVFLLTCSVAGGVVLAYARDLITIIVALETLTLPLYALVAMRGGSRRSAEAGVNFLLVSVAASAVTLFGAAVLYVGTGAVHLAALAETLTGTALGVVGVAMVIAGMSFKLAAVPLHGWAAGTYDGAPLPVAAYLSTVSKLGGVAALVWVVTVGFVPVLSTVWPILAVLAVATMTVGNLAALRQRRTVRLLAWSSIAQAGYVLVPLTGYAVLGGAAEATAAVIVFALLYVVMELVVFAALIGLRGDGTDGGRLTDLAGSLRVAPAAGIALLLGLAALAGLPPGLAGLFAKVAVISSVAEALPWLAVIVAVNAVIGLVYYVRFAGIVVRGDGEAKPVRAPWPVAVAAASATTVLVVFGFAPQLLWTALGF